SLLINSAMINHAPQALTPFIERGDEIVGHGRTNAERQGTLSEADEARLIAESRDHLKAFTGTAPKGWLGPWISQSHVTPDLLQEAGFT
ncbi:hypothetical protein ABTL74_19245, partial [Acinetobacter baumannii]